MAQTPSGKTPAKRSTPLQRDEIVHTARRHLQDSGLESLSLRRLAKALGVTAPALYAHVEHKGDLLTAVAEQGFNELAADFESVDSPDPLERIREYSRCYVRRALADPETFRLMFSFRPSSMAAPSAAIQLPAADAALEAPTAALAEAIERSLIHPGRDPERAAMALWICAHGVASILLLGRIEADDPTNHNPDALTDYVMTAMLNGLRTPAES